MHIALKAQKWIERMFGAGSEKSDFVSKAMVDYYKQKEWTILYNLGIKMVISLSKYFLCVRC